MSSKEIAIKEPGEFMLFNDPSRDIKNLVESNLGGEQFTPNEITRIPIPAGGGTTFEVPDPEGTFETKELQAVIVYVQPVRLYWSQPFGSGDNSQPDCMSNDLIYGYGNPGGKCSECPMNEFGSGSQETKSKACQEKRNIYILTPDTLLPYNLSAPVESIKNYKSYLQGLTRKDININSIVTRIGLEKAKNSNGINYSKLTFTAGPRLTPEQIKMLEDFKKSFAPIIDQAHKIPDAETKVGEEAPEFA